MCFATMLPKRRKVRDMTRAKWLMSSMGSMSGARPHIGSHEMLDVADAVPFYSDVMGRGEGNERERERGINVRGG